MHKYIDWEILFQNCRQGILLIREWFSFHLQKTLCKNGTSWDIANEDFVINELNLFVHHRHSSW